MFGKKPKQESGNPPRRKGADLMNQVSFTLSSEVFFLWFVYNTELT